jgi:hypothetical protein
LTFESAEASNDVLCSVVCKLHRATIPRGV